MQPNDRLYHLQFGLVHPEWYETLDYYQPSDELLRIARAIAPPSWKLQRSNVWFRMTPPKAILPRQGWKIHVSATPVNCTEILHRAANVCVQREVPFKFSLDRHLVRLSAYKGWPREASGKFITIYPFNDQHFCEILDTLYTDLKDFTGPYVLSDRRYRDARTLYYRYGGIDGLKIVSCSGDSKYMIVSPEGTLYPDFRMPYWNPPTWVSDPFQSSDSEETELASDEDEAMLKDGRYRIDQAISFSTTGGVYLATDLDSGATVIIKEARPATGVDNSGSDATDRLRKEFRLLKRLRDTGIAPAPIDLFNDWEHLFLVEEYVPGLDLGHFTIGYSPLMRIYPAVEAINAYVEKLYKIWTNLALNLAVMHEMGVICGDLSIKNVIVRNLELGEVWIVDLEAAWDEELDAPTQLVTPGFATHTSSDLYAKEADYYSLGAVMLGTLFPMNNLLEVEPSARNVFVEAMGVDLGLPSQVRQVMATCMSDVPQDRPTPRQVAEVIQQMPAPNSTPSFPPSQTPVTLEELQKVVSDVARYVRANADLNRTDRLFPADPLVFFTNPLSVAYGATGIAYALSLIDGEVPKPLLAWILSRPIDQEHYPPGLYLGSAGIAWALYELGMEEVAIPILRAAEVHPLLWDAKDIFWGVAGYGLACLHFYLREQDQEWLDRAIKIGEGLLSSKIDADDQTCYWPDNDGQVWLGYARGASGIALYLLYLSLATGNDLFFETSRRALAFDLGHLRTTEEGHLSVPRGTVESFENVLTHYWFDGSAGIASVVLRFWAHTKDIAYFTILELLAQDTFRKYTVFPGLMRGNSGLGNFLIDAYQLTGEEQYLDQAYRAASGVMPFKIRRQAGIAFPGEQLSRISTDFGTGSSGIALFLHRLAHVSDDAPNFNFTPDRLLLDRGERLNSQAMAR